MEASNIQDPLLAVFYVFAQALLETTMRLTVAERDAFIQRVLRNLCSRIRSRRGRATTAIVVLSHRVVAPLPDVPSLRGIVKEERVATAQERAAVKQRFRARTIL